MSYEFSHEKCSEICPEYVEPLFCGSEKAPAKFSPKKKNTKFPSPKNKKNHRRASAGAQGEQMAPELSCRRSWVLGKPCTSPHRDEKSSQRKSFGLDIPADTCQKLRSGRPNPGTRKRTFWHGHLAQTSVIQFRPSEARKRVFANGYFENL